MPDSDQFPHISLISRLPLENSVLHAALYNSNAMYDISLVDLEASCKLEAYSILDRVRCSGAIDEQSPEDRETPGKHTRDKGTSRLEHA